MVASGHHQPRLQRAPSRDSVMVVTGLLTADELREGRHGQKLEEKKIKKNNSG